MAHLLEAVSLYKRHLINYLNLLNSQAIILDLDDTIFPTKSMNNKIFEPFFSDLVSRLKTKYRQSIIDNIIDDLWIKPIDFVLDKYNIQYNYVIDSFTILENLKINLNIKPYPDYDYFKQISIPMYLVSNGIENLQKSKINALGIEKDFENIFINDPFKCSTSKLDIFRNILNHYHFVPEFTYVIGDNPDSEIEAGNKLYMKTIQILRENKIKGENACYYINSFYDLTKIIE